MFTQSSDNLFKFSLLLLITDLILLGSGRLFDLSLELFSYHFSPRQTLFFIVFFFTIPMAKRIYKAETLYLSSLIFIAYFVLNFFYSIYFLQRTFKVVFMDLNFILYLILVPWLHYLVYQLKFNVLSYYKNIILILLAFHFLYLIFGDPSRFDYLLRLYTNYQYSDFVIHVYSVFYNS